MIPLKDSIRSRRFPFVNWLIIAVNAWVFYQEMRLSHNEAALQAFVNARALVPTAFLNAPVAEARDIFTAMFMHAGFLHFFGNMLYLYIFGDNVEDSMGHIRYLFFYLSCGVLAGLTQVWMSPHSNVPMLGASGAIAGVLGAYFVLYPNARVLTLVPIWVFIRIIPLPAYLLLGFWFILQALQGTASLGSAHLGGVAWWAHAGGFLAGIALIFPFRSRRTE